MKRKLLLLLCSVLTSVSMWAWTSVTPQVGRSYYLYNLGTNAYFYGTNSDYTTTADITNATPITVESGYKLAYTYGGTTYRIYHSKGTKEPWNTSGVNFTLEGSATGDWGYQLKSRNGDNHDRWMCPDGTFQQSGKYYNRDWKFCSVYEVNSGTAAECASTAEASYLSAANGWERVTDNATLEASLSDYFFAIVCANYPGIMVNMADGNASQQASGYSGSKSMWYSNLANPKNDNSFLWMIEKCNESGFEGYTFRNASYPTWTVQAESSHSEYAHTHDQANPCKWSSYELAQSNGVYTIKTLANGGTNYLGLWTPSNDYANGQELAGNKSAAEQGKFLIYRIPRYKFDMTGRVVNPKAETNTDGWTGDIARLGGDTNTGFDGEVGIFEVADWWASSWDKTASQTINNLPNGYYQIQVAGQADANIEFMTLTANGVSNNFVATGTTGGTILADGTEVASGGVAGWHYNRVQAQVTNGSLTISIRGKATAEHLWTNFDNVSLNYIASSLTEDLTPVSGKMNADVNTTQQNAINTYNSSKTAANYIAAQEAIAAAESSKAAYANAATYLSSVENLLATTNFYTSTAYNSVYGTYKTAYDAGTLEDATAADLSYKVAGSGGTARYDANTANDLLIPGWTIGGNDASTSGSGFYINTWSNEDGNNGFANPFFEYWTSGASLSETTLIGTKTGLTANTLYRVTANVRIQGTANSGKIKMQVGTGEEIDVTKGNQIGSTSRYMKEYTALGMTDAEGKLTLKFNVESESNISWLSFRDIVYAEQDDDFTYLIKEADCTSQDYWPGNGRTTASGEHYSGDADRVYFTFTSGTDRHQDVTFPATGKYLLKTAVRCKVANTVATMSVGGASETTNFASSKNQYTIGTDGNETTTVNTDGGDWVYNELYFDADANDVKTITIHLTSRDNVGETDCGGMTLTYLGTAGTLVGMEVSAIAKAGTFVAPFNVVIPARTTAYTVKNAGSGYVSLQEAAAAGETLNANTPVILYAEDDITSKISKKFYGTVTGTQNENSDGYIIGMYGSDGTIMANAQNYVMQYNLTTSKAEFRQVTTNNFATTAYRCYLTLAGGNDARVAILIDDDKITGINTVEVDNTEDAVQKDGKYLEDDRIVIVKNGIKYSANGQKLN